MPAPVVAAAGRAATARAGAGAAGKAAAGKTAGKAAAGKATTTAAQQRDAIEAIKAARPADPAPVVDEHLADDKPARSSTSSKRSAPSVTISTKGGAGGGFVLGMLVYVVGLTYLRGGKPAVKQLIRAKFLNQVGPA